MLSPLIHYVTQPTKEPIMAYKINASACTACGACEQECPNDAIFEKSGLFAIKAGSWGMWGCCRRGAPSTPSSFAS